NTGRIAPGKEGFPVLEERLMSTNKTHPGTLARPVKASGLRMAVTSLLAVSLLAMAAALGQQKAQTDVGDLHKKTVEKAFKKPYSPYAGRTYPTRPYFGDTHLHTSFSFDAGAFGCRLGPKEAYRFAKGEEVVASMGERVKLARPLDFLVVTDHSDNL